MEYNFHFLLIKDVHDLFCPMYKGMKIKACKVNGITKWCIKPHSIYLTLEQLEASPDIFKKILH